MEFNLDTIQKNLSFEIVEDSKILIINSYETATKLSEEIESAGVKSFQIDFFDVDKNDYEETEKIKIVDNPIKNKDVEANTYDFIFCDEIEKFNADNLIIESIHNLLKRGRRAVVSSKSPYFYNDILRIRPSLKVLLNDVEDEKEKLDVLKELTELDADNCKKFFINDFKCLNLFKLKTIINYTALTYEGLFYKDIYDLKELSPRIQTTNEHLNNALYESLCDSPLPKNLIVVYKKRAIVLED